MHKVVPLALLFAGCASLSSPARDSLHPASASSARALSLPDAREGLSDSTLAGQTQAHQRAAGAAAMAADGPGLAQPSAAPIRELGPIANDPLSAEAALGEMSGDEGGDEAGDVGESHEVVAQGVKSTADLSDEKLAAIWRDHPAALGSISLGFVDAGHLLNGERFPDGEGWTVVSPEKAWGTRETIELVQAAIRAVRAQFPGAPALRVNQISTQHGGKIHPHKSHQNGRDVDLGFYYPGSGQTIFAAARENVIDLKLNWALVKALATSAQVQLILLDRRVQKKLRDFALAQGEERSFVDSLFFGKGALFQHARSHRDHFHVRFYNPRATELGRRVTPLLSQHPELRLALRPVHGKKKNRMLARDGGGRVIWRAAHG